MTDGLISEHWLSRLSTEVFANREQLMSDWSFRSMTRTRARSVGRRGALLPRVERGEFDVQGMDRLFVGKRSLKATQFHQ